MLREGEGPERSAPCCAVAVDSCCSLYNFMEATRFFVERREPYGAASALYTGCAVRSETALVSRGEAGLHTRTRCRDKNTDHEAN